MLAFISAYKPHKKIEQISEHLVAEQLRETLWFSHNTHTSLANTITLSVSESLHYRDQVL